MRMPKLRPRGWPQVMQAWRRVEERAQALELGQALARGHGRALEPVPALEQQGYAQALALVPKQQGHALALARELVPQV